MWPWCSASLSDRSFTCSFPILISLPLGWLREAPPSSCIFCVSGADGLELFSDRGLVVALSVHSGGRLAGDRLLALSGRVSGRADLCGLRTTGARTLDRDSSRRRGDSQSRGFPEWGVPGRAAVFQDFGRAHRLSGLSRLR